MAENEIHDDWMRGEDWDVLRSLGITFNTHPIKALAILARRVVELERLHRAHHEPWAGGKPPPMKPEAFYTAAAAIERQADEIRPSPDDLCVCGHTRRAHVHLLGERSYCAYGQIGNPACHCQSFRLPL